MKKKILIGILGMFILLCSGFMWFVNWANSDTGQQTLNKVGTHQAVESATAAAQAAQQSATATVVMQQLNARLQSAQLVFEEGLDKGSPFLAANIGDHDLTFNDEVATVSLPWDGFFVWKIGQQLTDFVAEVDCANYGSEINCGFAYGVHTDGEREHYYASLISGGYRCGFIDVTANFAIGNYPMCGYPHSSESWLQHLRLEKFGANIRFYVNGQLMDQRVLEKADFLSGDLALAFGRTGGEQSEMNEVRIDNLKVWSLPEP